MFFIDGIRGVVRVNQNLDRDKVAMWTAIVHVVDSAGGPGQTATGQCAHITYTYIHRLIGTSDRVGGSNPSHVRGNVTSKLSFWSCRNAYYGLVM